MWHEKMPFEYRNQIVTGDARELAERIPDESVDLVFTDPVYDRIDDYRWLAETAARILKPSGDCIIYLATYRLAAVIMAMVPHLEYRWLLNEKKLSSATLIWSYKLLNHVISALWFTKGIPRPITRIDFLWGKPDGIAVNHKWSKNAYSSAYWLNKFSLPTDIVWDPFCGGGAILSACKMLGRNYIASEIDPETADLARERVQNTQPPLFVLQPEQMALEMDG